MPLRPSAMLLAGALLACSRPMCMSSLPPLPIATPIVGESSRSVDDALAIAARTLAAQNFPSIRRDAREGTVTASRARRLNALGPEIDCQGMPDLSGTWVKHSVVVHATQRGHESTVSVVSSVQVGSSSVGMANGTRECRSTGLVEERVATALGLPVEP